MIPIFFNMRMVSGFLINLSICFSICSLVTSANCSSPNNTIEKLFLLIIAFVNNSIIHSKSYVDSTASCKYEKSTGLYVSLNCLIFGRVFTRACTCLVYGISAILITLRPHFQNLISIEHLNLCSRYTRKF